MKDERLEAYRKLYDGLSDMVEDRRVTREAIPGDYDWLIRAMLDVVALDPETPTPFPCCPKCLDVIAPDESSVERAGREYHAECDERGERRQMREWRNDSGSSMARRVTERILGAVSVLVYVAGIGYFLLRLAEVL